MGEMKKISLTQGTELELRKLKVMVYAPVFDKLLDIQDMFAKYEKIKDIRKQTKAAAEILLAILLPDNPDLTEEKITANFSMAAFVKVVELAMGA